MVEYFKKKVENEIKTYFPENVDNTATLEYYTKLKSKSLALLESVKNGVDVTEKVKRIEGEILSINKPQKFGGNKGVEVKHDKFNIELINLVKKEIPNTQTNELTVLEFYTTLENIKKANKK